MFFSYLQPNVSIYIHIKYVWKENKNLILKFLKIDVFLILLYLKGIMENNCTFHLEYYITTYILCQQLHHQQYCPSYQILGNAIFPHYKTKRDDLILPDIDCKDNTQPNQESPKSAFGSHNENSKNANGNRKSNRWGSNGWLGSNLLGVRKVKKEKIIVKLCLCL